MSFGSPSIHPLPLRRITRFQLPAALLLTLCGSAAAQQHHGVHQFHDDSSSITPWSAPYLRTAWETFNDDTLVVESPPTGFALEAALGLVFPSAVVGVVSPPVIADGTIYYADALGTVFARDARTGMVTDTAEHWTTTLSDPDFAAGDPPIAPELYYTSPIVTEDEVWIVGSVYGQVHRLNRYGGAEFDFDPSTPEIDPFVLVPDRPVSSVLGTPVIVDAQLGRLLIVCVNVIVNDAVFDGGETGLIIAYDISTPDSPVEAWRTPTIDINPATGVPYGTGVSAGSGLQVDEQRGYIYGGTGQNTSPPYPEYPDPEFAPAGYVDRGDSLYAIDFETGNFVWTSQFHRGDVFDLNDPVSTGPNQPGGPRDADVLAPPIVYSARVHGRWRDLVGDGSKGGLYRVVDRETGETMWQRQISKPTGIGGIQAGAAYADGVVYVAGFEGIDDEFSDAQFGTSLDTGNFANAFFATFNPAFWADVEDTAEDGDPSTGMRVKVYALDARTGRSLWRFPHRIDYVALYAGASLRQVAVENNVVFVTTSSGELFALDGRNGDILFTDQTPDLNEVFQLGLGKPHHASMNGGTVVADGMAFVPSGAQNNPSGGIYAYEVNQQPIARNDLARARPGETIVIDALDNDSDPNGDRIQFTRVAGSDVDPYDGVADLVERSFGTFLVINPGEDPGDPDAAYIEFTASSHAHGVRHVSYFIEDAAPNRIVNGIELNEPNPTHTPRSGRARIRLVITRQ